MMTFVVAAVDDRQIKTGGRTIETRRRLGGCGLRYGPQVSSAEQWRLPTEPNLTAAPLAPAPSAIPATGASWGHGPLAHIIHVIFGHGHR